MSGVAGQEHGAVGTSGQAGTRGAGLFGWPLRTWLVLGAVMVPVLAGGMYMGLAAERQTKEDPAVAVIAAANAGGTVEVFTGPDHTVYHFAAALPSATNPRPDGKPTLVWFTNTTCSRCEEMVFAHAVAAGFRDRMVFVEKATDRDGAAAAYGATDTPTFVLVDARGNEVARFGYLVSKDELRAAIAGGLGR